MIVIYGATGLAGELISRELSVRGVAIRIAGRDRKRLEALASQLDGCEVAVAAIHDPAALRDAFAGARVVIGCAGPFSRVGAAILEAAIAADAHYIDIAGEQSFLRDSYESFEAAAHRAGVVCVSGLAFRIALGDWAAALAYQSLVRAIDDQRPAPEDEPAGSLADRPPMIDEISVSYALSKPNLTARERAAAALTLASPTLIWRRDRWQSLAPGAERRRIGFGAHFGEHEAVLFGGGEVVTIPRHASAREVKTYLWLETKSPLLWETTRLAPLLAPVLGPLAAGPLGRFVRAQAEAVSAPSGARDRAETEFAIVATAIAGFERRTVIVRGRDPYRLTAEIASAGALALAKRPHTNGGVLAPAEVFDPRGRLYSLAARDLIEIDEEGAP